MRHAFAIIFIFIHLFNLGGYQLLFNRLENNSHTILISRLDKNAYSDNELIEVKVPIKLPYQISQADFERFDGEVDVDGTHFNYVKRKIQNDTLILLCIPNTERTSISTARETFFSLVNDINGATDSQAPVPVKSLKSTVSEFFQVETVLIHAPLTVLHSFPKELTSNNLISVYIEGSVKPPEYLIFPA